MASIAITEAELLDALARATGGDGPEDAKTGPELQAATGLSDKRLRQALKALHATGRLQVHKVWRENIAGVPNRVPAYTIRAA